MDHYPVLVHEILNYAKEIKNLKWVLDLTFGGGGHSRALMNKFPLINIMALDQDYSVVQRAKKDWVGQKNFFIYHENFHHFRKNSQNFNMILLDLGPSSIQLMDPERGFSFYQDGPLDMRMDRRNEMTACHILNQYSEDELFHLFRSLGEIKNPRPVIRTLIRQRKRYSIQYTKQLANLISKTAGWKRKGHHPATAYFLALRIEVNNELEGLKDSLPFIMESLSHEGRIFVLTFHSLEDRIVKNVFKSSCLKNDGFLVNKKVIRPTREEILSNKNSRSAKLRIFQKSREMKNV